jgi:beta-glucanase (GH16 family)
MKLIHSHPTRLWFASALVAGLFGCGNTTTSPNADTAALSDSANGGGGGTTGSGGSSTGGMTGTGGGMTGTGGATIGSGGRTADTGGTTIGSGGNSAGGNSSGGTGAGGNKSDGGPSGTGGTTRNDAGPTKDGGTDAQRDAAEETGTGDAASSDSNATNPDDAGINVPDGYKLVWSDEFNTDGTPNSKNWNYEKGFVRNSELQWYQSNNATVKDGVLIIEGRKEKVTNPNYSASGSDWKTTRQYAEYTSSSMSTSGLQTWQYGRFEMRARIPTSAGMWPAWWALGVSGEWPSSGEIDMMEFYKGNVLANVACGTSTRWSAKWDSSTKAISSLGNNWSSRFHIWRMDWDDQAINLYLDDTLMNGVSLSSMLNSDGTSPFKQKVYMILNLAIGGDNGGDPSSTTFPVQFEVDYVRVFQKL